MLELACKVKMGVLGQEPSWARTGMLLVVVAIIFCSGCAAHHNSLSNVTIQPTITVELPPQ